MAGLVATRLFAAAGAGGVALTAWALRRSGMAPRLVACRMVAFMVLLYVIYAGSLLIDGIGLGIGLFPGGGSFAITIVPAIVAAILFGVAGAMALLPGDLERRLERLGVGLGRAVAHWVARAVDRAGARGQRRAHRDRADPHPRRRPAGRARVVGLRHRRAVGDVPRVRLAAAVHGHLDGLLRRACSATCCRSPAASAASRAA